MSDSNVVAGSGVIFATRCDAGKCPPGRALFVRTKRRPHPGVPLLPELSRPAPAPES